MQKEIRKLLCGFDEDDVFFGGGASTEQIIECEKKLNVQFPDSYKWFIREYGFGGACETEINGVNINSGSLKVVEETEYYREFGLPKSMVVINSSIGPYILCLDTSKMEKGECPVVAWDQIEGEGLPEYKNFYEYYIEDLKRIIEDEGT
ncbi:SMI1/KNR4 family protein [Marininema halotolerans]|uniref:SMI1-KNR4 cell-wall n=1 Tax=Marininema halotolerans TaxID=1155944 RepID=A0A1I6UM06_9BACL|nr:SMI1/KNR4 family protein [Marininema halotolerans]SFT02472.1 SMI1-KNR4 cell-wall [Marininema halotolerans]